ncbi:CPBP family intramembrane metalloprotease [Patescibacteria group bacterium]|nr:CPBP family intramembrane metalloprotease [Patescibacteria group bacterium]
MAVFLVYLRIKALEIYPSRFFIKETLFISGIIVGIATLLIILAFILIKKKDIFRLKSAYFWKLLVFYFPWGFLQQLFFQFIFFETVYFAFKGNIFLSLLLSAVFFGLFHLGWTKKFFLPSLLIGFFFSGIYLLYGNLIWLALSHALLGTFLYVLFVKDNQLARRLTGLNIFK